MGIRAVVVASLADRRSLAVRMADGAVILDGYSAADTYLDVEAVIAAAKAEGCEAIHPGYGFLSERADFAERCAAAGIVFVGPPPGVLRALGDKSAARRLAVANGVPVAPGWDGADDAESLSRAASAIGYPVMLKARGGGGGRGMRQILAEGDLAEAIESARREALAAFGDGGLLLEKLVRNAHHVEVQVVADRQGNMVHLGERDCSVQRRHQKLIEESPSPVVDECLRADLTGAALRLAGAAGYENAGTFEFLVAGGPSPDWYFLEVNPRLQVEHPVTEAVTGLDLVELQLRVAAGERLPVRQEDVRFTGHAIEVRVNAENPWEGFRGSGGRIVAWKAEGRSRIDAGYEQGDSVPGSYDSLLAKVIAHGSDRLDAIARLVADVRALEIEGVPANLALAERILEHADFRDGAATVDWLDRELSGLLGERVPGWHWAAAAAAMASGKLPGGRATGPWDGPGWLGAGAAVCWLKSGPECEPVALKPVANGFDVTAAGEMHRVVVERIGDSGVRCSAPGLDAAVVVSLDHERVPRALVIRDEQGRESRFAVGGPPAPPKRTRVKAAGVVAVTAPLAGTVATVRVGEGETVEEGQVLVVLDAMKMEHRIVAPQSGVVRAIVAGAGNVVREGDLLVEMG